MGLKFTTPHDPEIKSQMLYRLSQEGASTKMIFKCNCSPSKAYKLLKGMKCTFFIIIS